jgi:hypothetical protein
MLSETCQLNAKSAAYMRLYLNLELAAIEGKVIERHDFRHNDTQYNGTQPINTHVLGHIEHFIAVYIQHV